MTMKKKKAKRTAIKAEASKPITLADRLAELGIVTSVKPEMTVMEARGVARKSYYQGRIDSVKAKELSLAWAKECKYTKDNIGDYELEEGESTEIRKAWKWDEARKAKAKK